MHSLDETLRIRREEIRMSRAMEMQRKRIKKEQKKDKILGWIITGLAILGIIICMNYLDKSYKDGMENCINAGHTREYCERGM